MKQYQWKEGAHIRGDAGAVGLELEKIETREGIVKPESVVKVARSRKSPMHDCFTWDDARAADMHRLDEARHLVRSLRVYEVIEEEGEPQLVRAFHHVKDPERGDGYQPIMRVMSDTNLREQAIEYSIGLLNQAKERLAELRGLQKSCKQIESIVLHLTNKKTKAARR
jgi:hypothetical protein